MCLRSLKTTTIPALETEAGSMPLPIRREYLARKQILKTLEKKFPMKERLERLEYRLDDYKLNSLETNYVRISDLFRRDAKITEY